MAGKSPADKAAGALGFSAAAMVLCCGTHLLVVGVLGGLAAGTFLGVGAGVLAVVAFAAAVLIIRRRRSAACGVSTPRSGARVASHVSVSSGSTASRSTKEDARVV